ncbi:hypothetical protein L8106_24080 [Lyngbya sp. PCC 8106]|nr:hypothetical protein L8106_24080 [Lyngbya sp. PCC 8106]
MNCQSIFRKIYLITATFIYMVAVALVLVGIVVFAIFNETSKLIQPYKTSRQPIQKKLEYTKFKPMKASAVSSKEKHLWS